MGDRQVAAQKFDANIGKVAFKVDLVSRDGGKRSLRWQSVEDGKAVAYDSEPYVGLGTRLASRVMRTLPVEWLL